MSAEKQNSANHLANQFRQSKKEISKKSKDRSDANRAKDVLMELAPVYSVYPSDLSTLWHNVDNFEEEACLSVFPDVHILHSAPVKIGALLNKDRLIKEPLWRLFVGKRTENPLICFRVRYMGEWVLTQQQTARIKVMAPRIMIPLYEDDLRNVFALPLAEYVMENK